MLDVITDHIDIWTSAEKKKSSVGRGSSSKFELYGIKKLRELILDLAVQGKLVTQDPNDEPASQLLKKIEEEKERLVQEKKIRKQKPLPVINSNKKPFDLPQGWEWCRLGNAGIGSTGKTPSTNESKYFDGEIPFIGPGQITPTGELIEPDKFLTEEGLVNSTEAVNGDILMVCIGGSIGKSVICDKRIAFNQQINAIKPIFITSRYLHIAVSTNLFYQSVLEKSTGSATPIINRLKWEELLIPIAPKQEQNRIIKKVDELMALCDQLEEEEIYNKAAHQTLVKTLLNTLTSVKIAEEFKQSWQRIFEHFDILFTTEESIEELKQTILQLAVMGKLVPQDPNDEPASELLKKFHKEKQRLNEEGKTEKQNQSYEILDEKKPFELKKGWAWARPDSFSHKITDGEHFRPLTQEDGIYFLSAKDIRSEGVSLDNPLYISEEIAEKALQRCNPERGDILIVSRGATVGRMCTVDIDDTFCLLGSVILIKPVQSISSDFLKIVMKTPQAMNQFVSASGSTAQPAIYLRDIKKILFPIAPLAEQCRIVTKVDELITLCDSLKVNIGKAQNTQEFLADSIVDKTI